MKLKNTHIICIANNKGGCGKTTTTTNTAVALAELGHRICVVGCDEQCNLEKGFGFDIDQHLKKSNRTVLDVFLNRWRAVDIAVPVTSSDGTERFKGRVHIISGHKQLSSTKRRLDAELTHAVSGPDTSELDEDDLKEEQRLRLKNSLDTLRGEFDVVLIDTPPNLEFLTTSSLIAADWLIIPVFPSGYDLDGLEKLQVMRRKVVERYNPDLRILGVLLGDKSATANLDDQIFGMLKDEFGPKVFGTTIASSVRHRECTIIGQSIFELEPTHQGAHQFRHLAMDIVERLNNFDEQVGNSSNELMEANR